MTLNLADSELKALVKTHINGLIGVPEDRLKVTFMRRQTQTDTSVEILQEGEPKSIVESITETVAEKVMETVTVANEDSESETQEPTDTEQSVINNLK